MVVKFKALFIFALGITPVCGDTLYLPEAVKIAFKQNTCEIPLFRLERDLAKNSHESEKPFYFDYSTQVNASTEGKTGTGTDSSALPSVRGELAPVAKFETPVAGFGRFRFQASSPAGHEWTSGLSYYYSLLGLEAACELPLSPAVIRSEKLADLLYRKRPARIEKVLRDNLDRFALSVTVAYFDLAESQNRALRAAQEEDRAQKDYESVKIYFDGGSVPESHVIMAQAQYKQAMVSRYSLEAQTRKSRRHLSLLIGQEISDKSCLSTEIANNYSIPPIDSLLLWLTSISETIKDLNDEIAALSLRTGYSYYASPLLNVSLGYMPWHKEWSHGDGHESLTDEGLVYGAGIRCDIVPGRTARYGQRAAQLELQRKQLLLEQEKRGLEETAMDLRESLGELELTYDISLKAVEAGRAAVEISGEELAAGAISLSDVQLVRDRFESAYRDLEDVQRRRLMAMLEVLRIQGRLQEYFNAGVISK